MAAIGASDFKYGLDRRRPRAAGAPGTLWDCQNAHITRGGDIEAMRKFEVAYKLPAGTFGLAQAAGQLYTFGSLNLAATVPTGIRYVRCFSDEAQATITITGGTSSPGVNKITQITAAATNLLAASVDWVTSNAVTATAVAAAITANTIPNGGYTATASGAIITIFAPIGGGASANGRVVTPTDAGNVTTTNTNFAGGVTANMVRVLHAKAFESKIYVIAEFDDGMLRHYFNGIRVTDWDALADANSTVNTLATYLASKIAADSTVSVSASANVVIVTANVPGVPFTISATAIDKGVINDQTATVATPQPNVAAVSEVQATATVTVNGGSFNPGVNQVSQITAGGVPLMAAPVDWILSNEATAAAIAAAINTNAAHNGGFTAAEAAGVITISAPPGAGAFDNGIVVAATVNGVSGITTNFVGGISAVTAVAQVSTVTLGGTFETKDLYTITVNAVAYTGTGRASGTGTIVFVYRQRIYSPANTVLLYCALNNAADWHNTDPASGAGLIDFAVLMDGSERISGLAVYAGYVAIFLPKTILIYNLAPDATTVSQVQLIPNTGTIAGLSAQQYGLDSFYLDSSGVRSLRRADITNIAITNDIGTVVDPLIQSWVASVGVGATIVAEAVIEPFDARYWIAIGTRIFVLSLFSTAQVSAWSYYDIGLAFNSFTRIYNRLYARAGDTIYLYGGASGTAYPAAGAAPITVALPFMSAGSPTSFKEWSSFDMACSGAWTVTFLPDPDDETAEIQYGTAINTTYSSSLNATVGRTPLVAIRFNCSSGGQATLSSFSADYKSIGDK